MAIQKIQIVPDNFNPYLQQIQWADIVPEFNLPAGKIFSQKKGEWSTGRMFNRGVNLISNRDLGGLSNDEINALRATGKLYHDTPITPELLGLQDSGQNQWIGDYGAGTMYNTKYFPNGLLNYQQGFDKGNQCDVSHRVVVAETMENLHYTNPNQPMWEGYYDAKKIRMDAQHGAGNWLMSHDYLFSGIAPDIWNISAAQAKSYFSSPETLPEYWRINGALKHCNLHTSPVYLGSPDRDHRVAYSILYSASLTKHLGRFHCSVPTPTHEWRPNNLNGYKMQEGTLYRYDKHPVSLGVVAGYTVLELIHGDGQLPWGAFGKVTNKQWSPYWMEQFANDSFWIDNNGNLGNKNNWRSFPHLANGQDYNFVNYTGGEDVWSFAAYAYAATFGQVHGGTRKFAKFKIGNGDWINPAGNLADDVVNTIKNNLPIVETEIKNGKEAILVLECITDNLPKEITVIGQTGKEYKIEVCGNMPELSLQNL